MNKQPRAELSALESRLGYCFRDTQLAILALTHLSAQNSGGQGRAQSYQRLEFLGDRVLGVAVAEMLYVAYPQATEGEYEVRLLPPPVLEGAVPKASFRVDAPASELEHVQMNEPELVRAANTSHGIFYTPLTVGGLLDHLPKPEKVPLDTDPPIPLWNTWPVLGVFLTILTAEWLLRKRKQMV